MVLSSESASRFFELVIVGSIVFELFGGFNVFFNSSWVSSIAFSFLEDLVVIGVIGVVFSVMGLVGVVGNVYTLVVMFRFLYVSVFMYIYVVNLALVDLFYLFSIFFIVVIYVIKEWYFGDVGCRIFFSLDFLIMYVSIFILIVMSSERYVVVLRSLDTV